MLLKALAPQKPKMLAAPKDVKLNCFQMCVPVCVVPRKTISSKDTGMGRQGHVCVTSAQCCTHILAHGIGPDAVPFAYPPALVRTRCRQTMCSSFALPCKSSTVAVAILNLRLCAPTVSHPCAALLHAECAHLMPRPFISDMLGGSCLGVSYVILCYPVLCLPHTLSICNRTTIQHGLWRDSVTLLSPRLHMSHYRTGTTMGTAVWPHRCVRVTW